MEKFIKRHTLLHDNRKSSNSEWGKVIKVEGKEYLPEGFIELDPLLLKD